MAQIRTQDIADSQVTNVKVASGIDAAKVGGGTVSNTAFAFVATLSSAAQSQIDTLTSGKAPSATTLAGYGITDGVPNSRTVNGQALSSNVTISTISGNAGSATALQTTRAINGTNFDGSAAITITCAAGTLTGATLAAGVTGSSLTSLGTIATGVWQGTKVGVLYGGTNADLSGTGVAGGTLMQLSTGAAVVVKQRPVTIPLYTGNNTSVNWNAMPLAATEIHTTSNHGVQTTLDLSGFTQYRLVVRYGAGGVAGAKLFLRGSVGGSGVHNLEDTSDTNNTAAVTRASETEVVGAWTALHATYAVDGVLVTVYGSGGDGTTALAYRRVEMQVR